MVADVLTVLSFMVLCMMKVFPVISQIVKGVVLFTRLTAGGNQQ